MQVGDFVQSLQGAWRRVVAITPLPGQETVYNFTVDKDHDYFVGETGFLVHNEDCEPCHLNTLGDQETILYGLPDLLYPDSPLPAKWGMTSLPLNERYSAPELAEMGAGPPVELMRGPRWKIEQIERELYETTPGRLNKERTAGCRLMPWP